MEFSPVKNGGDQFKIAEKSEDKIFIITKIHNQYRVRIEGVWPLGKEPKIFDVYTIKRTDECSYLWFCTAWFVTFQKLD